MNKKLILIIPIILLLTTPTLAGAHEASADAPQYSTERYCKDNNTLTVRLYNTTSNNTISTDEYPSRYGCVNGTLTTANTINQYNSIATFGLLTITSLILVLAWIFGKNHGYIRDAFTFLAGYFLYLTANTIHGAGQRFTGITQIQTTSQALNIAAQSFFWILFFAVLYFFLILVRRALTYFRGGNGKSYGDKYGGG